MKSYHLSFVLLFSLVCAAAAAPRLVVSTPSLAPETKIDLVLDQPVVANAELGKTVDNDWLEIAPPLPGKLRWKAPNIAEFVMGDPPVIGGSYTFSIREGRVHADGSAVPAGKVKTLECERFLIRSSRVLNRYSSGYSASTGEWLLTFNDAVDPAAAAGFFIFASAGGTPVAAITTRATVKQAGFYGQGGRAWSERWGEPEQGQRAEQDALAHVLLVKPSSPLPPGEKWSLFALPGLPNERASARLLAQREFGIGTIKPFEVSEIESRLVADDPRRITISFTHPLPEDLPEGGLERLVRINPKPEILKAEVSGRQLHLTGDLLDHHAYTVTVPKDGLRSVDGFGLARGERKVVKFQHLNPGIALPSEDVGQLAKGNRKYRMQTLNLENATVRIKRLGGSNLIRAFQGYRHFTGNGPDHQSIEPTAPVPYSLIVGRPVAEREIPLGNPVDTTRVVTLDWNELLPGDSPYGVLFLEASGTPRGECKARTKPVAQAIVQLTDIGLAWKMATDGVLVYAFSCETGQPLSGVKLRLFGEDAEGLESVMTGDDGQAVLPRSEKVRHLRATLGRDCYVTAFDGATATVGMWHFPVRHSWMKQPPVKRRAFLFTDRSLYRPGETVRLKGIVRSQHGNAVEPAQPAKARIVIRDPANREILNKEIRISENGSFDLSHKLTGGKTGTHSVRLEFPDELARAEETEDWQDKEIIRQSARFTIRLRVEEFRRNAFEVTQEIPVPEPGAVKVAARLGAKYYQGQPVAAGRVKAYSGVTTRNPYPERFRDFQFGNHRKDDWGYWYHYFGYGNKRSREVKRGVLEATLSEDGLATLEVELPEAEFPTSREVTVSSEVTDANLQTLTARSSVTVHPAAVYIGISRIDRLVRAGEEMPLRIVAADTRGEPFGEPLQLTATLSREVNSTVKIEGENGGTTTRNDVSEENVSVSEFTLDPAASAAEGREFVVRPEASGLHFLTIRGKDAGGRDFATVTRFHAYGTDEYPWLYEDGMRVKLVAEKKSYRPGETARVLVLSPIEGTALVTVEREKVLRSFLTPLKADDPVIEIPLTEDDAPNAYVSVLVVKGAADSKREFQQPQLRLGYCELTVENLRDRLAVEIDAGPESYRPGDEVDLTGSVRLADGSPAAGAEVTLYAEDEGTLAVAGYDTPQPMKYFYQPRLLEVDAGTSFLSFIAEDPERQSFHNKGFFVGGGGDSGQLADLMRKNFDPCATWVPSLVTAADGSFRHRFKLPDTLTRYRIIAVAHQDAARFGHGESAVVAKKDLMLEPKSPRFAHQTDTPVPQVLVQNASGFEGTWELRFNAHAADGSPVCRALGETTVAVTLAAGKSTTVSFPIRVENTGEAVLSWSAVPVSLQGAELTDDVIRRLSDVVEARFESLYPMPLLRQVKFVRLDDPAATTNLLEMLDGNLLDGNGSLDLEFSRSPLTDAAGSIEYLLRYPYGCVEQTTSSLIPWCAVKDMRPFMPAFGKIGDQRVKEALQSGADRLLSMQLADGSFSYWPGGDHAVDWATPYAGLGLLLAREAGAVVPDSALDLLKQYLGKSLRGMAAEKSPEALEIHARSLLVLAMAGDAQTAYQNAMTDRLADLSPAARSLLAAAVARSDPGNAASEAAAREVLTSAVPFPKEADGWMRWSPDKALELIAWTMIDPTGPEAMATLDRMLHERNPYGHWRTTWVNGWSLLGMSLYARHEHHRSDTVAVNLETNDGVEAVRLSPESPTAGRTVRLGPNLKAAVTADGGAFVRMRVASKPPVMPLQPVGKNGLSVDRIYDRIDADGTSAPLTEPQPGDLIRVTLRVTLPDDNTRYLVIEDPLPSVFETVNSGFKSQSAALNPRTSENDWNVSHSELRGDRAVFFLDHVWRKGTYEVSYLARCTLPGQATAPPAKVESMYDPENFALSASRVFSAD